MPREEHSHHDHGHHGQPSHGRAAAHAGTAVKPGAIYTCPMHPEIRQVGPGSCPKCGMALVPVEGAKEDDSELRSMTRRFWVSAALTAPLAVIAMAPYFGIPIQLRMYVNLPVGTPVVLRRASPFFPNFPPPTRT